MSRWERRTRANCAGKLPLYPLRGQQKARLSSTLIGGGLGPPCKIEAEIVYAEEGLTVKIRDDGQGIDGAELREGRPGHFGLLGMRERAKNLGAHLRIWSRPGAGTEVEIRVPAPIAYRKSARRTRRKPWWRKAPDAEDGAL